MYLFLLCHIHNQYKAQVIPSIVYRVDKDDDPILAEALKNVT